MKILSYRIGDTTSWGAAVGDGVVDLASLTGFPTVRIALERGDMTQIAQLLAGAQVAHALDAVELLPMVPDPCVD